MEHSASESVEKMITQRADNLRVSGLDWTGDAQRLDVEKFLSDGKVIVKESIITKRQFNP